MEAVVIVVIILGIVALFASFFIKERPAVEEREKDKIASEIKSKAMSDENMDAIVSEAVKRFGTQLDDITSTKVTEAGDKMDEKANEKMLAINDMSGQVAAKIEENHKEVVFLYDMLNEKSDNLKDYSNKIEGMKRQIENDEKILQSISSSIDEREALMRASRNLGESRMVDDLPTAVDITAGNDDTRERAGRAPLTGIEAAAAATKKAGTAAKAAARRNAVKKAPEAKITDSVLVETLLNGEAGESAPSIQSPATQGEVNKRIVDMADSGKSVLEISKELGMGQGEVRLILGLYGNKR